MFVLTQEPSSGNKTQRVRMLPARALGGWEVMCWGSQHTRAGGGCGWAPWGGRIHPQGPEPEASLLSCKWKGFSGPSLIPSAYFAHVTKRTT